MFQMIHVQENQKESSIQVDIAEIDFKPCLDGQNDNLFRINPVQDRVPIPAESYMTMADVGIVKIIRLPRCLRVFCNPLQ